ncbi:MAG: hypothetical protein IPN29_20315 [Saprospiraceae bacterium]|nr:hypothetical protein [Saprospiraceae bacterium]
MVLIHALPHSNAWSFQAGAQSPQPEVYRPGVPEPVSTITYDLGRVNRYPCHRIFFNAAAPLANAPAA